MILSIRRLAVAAGLCLSLAAPLAGAPSAFAADETVSEADRKAGQKAYKRFCSHCHGLDLKNPGTASFDLRKWPSGQHDRFVDTVSNGKGDMPAWGDILRPEEIEVIYAYIISHPDRKK